VLGTVPTKTNTPSARTELISPVFTFFSVTPSTPSFPSMLRKTLSHMKWSFGFKNARSCTSSAALSRSRRWTIVTLSA
jgi:hypothetical protein